MPAWAPQAHARTRLPKGITLAMAIAVFVGACSSSTASPLASPSPSPRASTGPVEFQAALCTAVDEYLLGYGNPESGNTSDVWKAMEAGVEQGDQSRVDNATNEILTRMAASRAAIKRGAGYEAGAPAIAELDASAAAIETYVSEVRSVRGNKDEVLKLAPTLGRAWPPFLNWMRLLGEGYTSGALTINMPCPPDAPRG